MTVDSLLSALSAVFYALFLIVSVYIYASLLRQISSRLPDLAPVPRREFGLPEAFLASFLAFFFLLTIGGSSPRDIPRIDDRHLIASTAIIVGLVLALAGFLRLRRFNLDSLGGFSKIGFFRTAITAAVLIFFAYPIIMLADIVTQRFLRGPPDQQAILEMFNGSGTLQQRVLIIFLAVAIAPVAEEFIFRFFLYGVARRYFGKVAAVIVSALLFAAVHGHLPSFGPLVVLGGCLAIAYEWSGSILVPMTMHALFNAVTLTALAFPNRFQQ